MIIKAQTLNSSVLQLSSLGVGICLYFCFHVMYLKTLIFLFFLCYGTFLSLLLYNQDPVSMISFDHDFTREVILMFSWIPLLFCLTQGIPRYRHLNSGPPRASPTPPHPCFAVSSASAGDSTFFSKIVHTLS